MNRFRSSLANHPLQVLAYSCRHGYSELSDETAPNTLKASAPTALSVLGYDGFVTWVSTIFLKQLDPTEALCRFCTENRG